MYKPLDSEDQSRALKILAKLKATREANAKDFCKTDKEIVDGMKSLGWKDFTSRQLQEMVHWLAVEKHPIGSGTSGYFFCSTVEDFETSIRWSEGRISRISERVRAQKEARDDLAKRLNGFFESPAMEKLVKDFDVQEAQNK